MKNSLPVKIRKDATNILKLSECNNIMRSIAEVQIRFNGVYYCTVAGVKTAVVGD